MKYVLEMLEGLFFFALFVAAAYFWFVALINQFRASNRLKPGVSRHRAIDLIAIFFRHDLFTEEGERAARRCRYGAIGFITCILLALVIGKLTGH